MWGHFARKRSRDERGQKYTMQVAKCEGCEKEVKFETYKHDWPVGWVLTGKSRWGKEYHRRSGWAWWCPECDKREICRDKMLDKLPIPVQRALRRRGRFHTPLQVGHTLRPCQRVQSRFVAES